ncbi:hypothetical protein CECT5772_08079 [Streptococcus equi subsp. ruminatorum CECT 5772]|uniref:Uncharacterized protein n=1 Tax=Streptococcus equi subsp. ruminatorum CECT 5772 TaxID=1051981 RepID=A0A922NTJ3_9STRE|nr:hypothetical protein CECT5772_08079 [Streptococcus equi subsp. ruminatorum CECT 5772]
MLIERQAFDGGQKMVKPASVQLVGGSLKSRQKQEDIYAFW